MAECVDADDLQEEAQGHRWQAESVVTNRAHSHEPGDHDRGEGQPGDLAIDALIGAEPEESDEEEADAAEHPEPRDEFTESTVDKVVALLASTSDIEKWIDLEPWLARHRSIHDWA